MVLLSLSINLTLRLGPISELVYGQLTEIQTIDERAKKLKLCFLSFPGKGAPRACISVIQQSQGGVNARLLGYDVV